MSLTTYRKKRSFDSTPEPMAGQATGGSLKFVIQKHAASHLHYDFRLEMDGVLKSWAVPKGPSTDPDVKRLAMMVEDHPYDYKDFEGIIPKGQYGGGTVIVWDQGIYHTGPEKYKTKKEEEKNLLAQLRKGKLTIHLEGEKLKGEFAMVKSNYQGENSWLLIKKKDRFSKATDVLSKSRSVISGKTIEQMAKAPDKVYKSNKEKKSVAGKTTTIRNKKADTKKVNPSLKKGEKKKFPSSISPMLATLVDTPFDEDGWSYEIKWDGYRALAMIHDGKAELKSRNDKSFNEKFYPIYDALQELKINAILDGEVVVLDENGISNFGKLQNWRSEADGELIFYVFDVLWLNGFSTLELTLEDRRALLKDLLPDHPLIKLSETFQATGKEFFEVAKKLNLEGIMAKKNDSEYHPGSRSKEWLKIKVGRRHEVVIGGYTKNEGSSKSFSSLLVGVYKGKKLQYTGKIGTGFNTKQQKEMLAMFDKLKRKTSPFESEPDVNKPSRFRPDPPHASAQWLNPILVCEVSYTEITSDGVMRHPSFEGMREDKKSTNVKEEKSIAVPKKLTQSVLHKEKLLSKTAQGMRKTLLNPTDVQQVRKVQGEEITFNNLNKIYWPKDKISKRDMLNYYYQVAPYMLPYLKDRPQSMNRHPNGINGMSFYQKDVTGKVPGWVKTFPYVSDGKKKQYLVCDGEASLLYMASLGCIEINPWSSTVKNPDNPDWCIIDIDPDKNKFDQVVEVALVTRKILKKGGVECYCKTSGSTGLHIYIPLGGKYDYETSKEFARLIATLVHEELPGFTSIERPTARRKGKIYIDFLQNRPQATLAAPYSVRPKPGATVSMPLRWTEVKKGLDMNDFNIHTALKRLKKTGDIFKPVLGKGANIKKALQLLQTS